MESQKTKKWVKKEIINQEEMKQQPMIEEEKKTKPKRKWNNVMKKEEYKPQFEKSTSKQYKYSVITPAGKKVNFGDKWYQQFKDTALGVFSHLDHNDPKRQEQYFKWHGKIMNKDSKLTFLDVESPSYYSWKYLWSGKTD